MNATGSFVRPLLGVPVILLPATGTKESVRSSALDCAGAGEATFIVSHGEIAEDASMLWSLHECAIPDGTFSPIAGAEMKPSSTPKTQMVFDVDLRARLRYLRIHGTHSGSGEAQVMASAFTRAPRAPVVRV